MNNLSDLKKLESSSVWPEFGHSNDPEEILVAILKVKEPNYEPKNVTIRARISEYIVTCSFQFKELENLEKDARVDSISISRPMNIIS